MADSEATKANIMQKLTQLAASAQPEDTVIVYFAEHDPGKSSVQRPRIFYRRELESNPLVVAILGATPLQ